MWRSECSSAIILGMIALLIGYEAVLRLFEPVAIRFNEAIPIAILGLCVNAASAWLSSRKSCGCLKRNSGIRWKSTINVPNSK